MTQRRTQKKNYVVKRGMSWHEEIIAFVLEQTEGRAVAAKELYARFTEGRRGYFTRERFSMILSDETLRCGRGPRIERVLHGVYRKAGAKVEFVPKNFEQEQHTGGRQHEAKREGSKNITPVKGPHKRKVQFYTPQELLRYAKANGLTERDVADSVDGRRVGMKKYGPGTGYEDL